MSNKLSIIEDIDDSDIADSIECDPQDISKHVPNLENSFSVVSQNIRSIYANFTNLQVTLSQLDFDPDIIILTECWLNPTKPIPTLPNYVSKCTLNNLNQNDGVVIFAKNYLNASFEVIALEHASCIQVDLVNTTILGIYRSPSNSNALNFINSLNKHLETLNLNRSVIISGDININLIPRSSEEHKDILNRENYLNMLSVHGILPGLLKPTRLGNCIDHIMLKIKNKTTKICTAVLNTSITDHNATVLLLFNHINTPTSKSLETVNYKLAVTLLLQKNIENLLSSNDPNFVIDQLLTDLGDSINGSKTSKVIPSRRRIIKPWITPGLLRCIRNRNKMQLRLRADPDNVVLQVTFKRYRNYTNNIINKLKRHYEREMLEKNAGNAKDLWSTIKNLTNYKPPKTSDTDLLKCKSSPSESLDYINDFFTNIGKNLASKIYNHHRPNQSCHSASANIAACTFALVDTDPEEVTRVIMSLKTDSAPGYDGVTTKFLKLCSNLIAPIISHLANLCFAQGVFPSALKKSLVTPVFKSGTKTDPNSYRPISVLTAISKIIEKLINTRLKNYLNKFDLLSKSQFGFRQGLSTEDAVLNLSQFVTREVDKGNKCAAVFLDLKKAFDTVSFPLLLLKLEHMGIRGKPLELFYDYLRNRRQRVRIGCHHSAETEVSFGVPQGSVLGPTLFLIYINDLANVCSSVGHVILYADDTVALFSGKSWDTVFAAAERGLSNISAWLISNLLTLNTSKSNFICFSKNSTGQPPETFKLKLHNCNTSSGNSNCDCIQLDRVSSTKYLGVIFDQRLSWYPHIDFIKDRVRKLIWIFKTLRHVTTPSLLNKIYLALAQSVLSYCIPAWGGANKTKFLEVERVQRCLLKIMYFKPYRYPTALLYNHCNLLSMRKLYILSVVLKKHKNLIFDPSYNNHRRLKNVAPCPRIKSAFARRQYDILSALLYNKLNLNLNFYPLNLHGCKVTLSNWLKQQDYNGIEDLILPNGTIQHV